MERDVPFKTERGPERACTHTYEYVRATFVIRTKGSYIFIITSYARRPECRYGRVKSLKVPNAFAHYATLGCARPRNNSTITDERTNETHKSYLNMRRPTWCADRVSQTKTPSENASAFEMLRNVCGRDVGGWGFDKTKNVRNAKV